MMKQAWWVWLATLAMAGAQALTFQEPLKEVKPAPESTSADVEFAFTNKTGKPVSIVRYDTACSCMSLEVAGKKMRYEPGESGVIHAKLETGNFTGTVDKTAMIWLEGDPTDKPSVQLTVRLHIIELMQLEPKTVRWDLGGKKEPRTIRITVPGDKPIHVKSVNSSNPAFALELKTLEDGRSYDLIVNPADMAVAALGVLRIETDCGIEQQRIKQGFAVVRKPVPAEAGATSR